MTQAQIPRGEVTTDLPGLLSAGIVFHGPQWYGIAFLPARRHIGMSADLLGPHENRDQRGRIYRMHTRQRCHQ